MSGSLEVSEDVWDAVPCVGGTGCSPDGQPRAAVPPPARAAGDLLRIHRCTKRGGLGAQSVRASGALWE